MSFHCLR